MSRLLANLSNSCIHPHSCPLLCLSGAPRTGYLHSIVHQDGILEDKVPRILAENLEPSGKVLNKYHTLLLWFWDITKNNALLSRFYIRRMKYSRYILPRKQIFGKKLRATGRNLLWQEELSCHRKKFPITGRNFLQWEEIFHKYIFPVRQSWYFFLWNDI